MPDTFVLIYLIQPFITKVAASAAPSSVHSPSLPLVIYFYADYYPYDDDVRKSTCCLLWGCS